MAVKEQSSWLVRLVREWPAKVVFARLFVAGWLRIPETARATRRAVQQEVAVALYMQQARDGAWRFELLPNRSSSRPQVECFLIVSALFDGFIAMLFAWQGR